MSTIGTFPAILSLSETMNRGMTGELSREKSAYSGHGIQHPLNDDAVEQDFFSLLFCGRIRMLTLLPLPDSTLPRLNEAESSKSRSVEFANFYW